MKYKLQDLIDIKHFQNIQDRLHALCTFPSSILDNDGNILTATGWQTICSEFHRKNQDSEKLCIKSDQYIKDHIHEANPAVSYRCPHGLVDIAMPIIIEGIHYGIFFTGQFFLEKPDMEFFRTQAQKYGFDKDSYLTAVKNVPVWSQEQLDNYLLLIKELIAVISESGLKKLKEIENRKQMEAREKRHQSILKTAMDGYWLTDTKGRLLEVNSAYCRMSGYSEDDLLTMCIADLEVEENSQVVAQHMQKVISQGSDRFESRHRCKDGSVFDVEVSVQFRNEHSGQCVFFLRDIAERKRAEEELWESRERFRELAELLPETIFEIALDSTVIFVNRMAFEHFRYTKKDFERGLNALDMIVPEDRSRTMENMRKILAGEKVGLTEYRALRKDGTTFPAMFHSAPIIRDGNPVGLRGFIIDISEKKRLENQLLQSQKMEAIGTLAGGIAHDFNNILGAILGYAEMIQEDCPAGSTMRGDIDRVVEASQRAKELIKQILEFSRHAESTERALQPALIVKEAMKMLRASIPTNIYIHQDIRQDVGLIFADPIEIHQIVTNLSTNAFHSMENTGGTITVSLKNKKLSSTDLFSESHVQPGLFVELSVGDTGSGISPQIIDNIFDPFFTTKEVGKGTGMGLAIVHGIAKKSGGFVSCISSPGQGTTFSVYLPIHAVAAQSEAETAPVELIQTGIEHILFIDDEEMLVEMGKTILERLGYRVTVKTDSIEALKIIQDQPDHFDLVITDQTMPGMTGSDLARRILQIRPGMPIILCTGFSNLISEEKARTYGIKGFAMKPLAQKDLAALIRSVLDGEKK